LVATAPSASRTRSFTVNEPALAGVPEIVRVLAANVSPRGSPVILHRNRATPPRTAIFALYA
jgi:hypothetical protein